MTTLTKQDATWLQRDFIPNGPPVDISTLTFRRTRDDEVFQCCASSSYDPQSGPIFCGRVSEWVASVPLRGLVALCDSRHAPPARNRAETPEPSR